MKDFTCRIFSLHETKWFVDIDVIGLVELGSKYYRLLGVARVGLQLIAEVPQFIEWK